jgi:lysophospholipase L1-like esterase
MLVRGPLMSERNAMDILFMGDSLIEFFDWAGRFPGHRVANLGISGETVEGLHRRLEAIISTHPSADTVFLMSGINNLAMEDTAFPRAYGNIISRLSSAYPSAEVFVNSLLPTLMPWISPEGIVEMNTVLRDLAMKTGAVYLDIHSLFINSGLRQCLLEDGVHISGYGYEVWSGALAEIIDRAGGAGDAGD